MSSSLAFLHFLLPSTFPPVTFFRRLFLRKMWPIQLAFLLVIVHRIRLSPWLYTIILHFSHVRSSTTFQKCPRTSDLLSEVSKFHHNTQLCSKCSTSLVYSLNFSPENPLMPIPVAAPSKAWVCGLSHAESSGSNPAGAWTSVSCVCCVL
jgi:hypothetical protein